MSSSLSSTSKPEGRINKSFLFSADLSFFLNEIENYEPTVPIECVQYYMEKSGITVKDEKVVKIVALAADKFLCDTIYEAKQIGKLRGQKRTSKRKASDITDSTLNMEDLSKSLWQQRIHLMRKAGTLMVAVDAAEGDHHAS